MPDSYQPVEEALIDVDGTDIPQTVVLVTFGEDAPLDPDTPRVDADHHRRAAEPGDEGWYDEPEKEQVPEVTPPGGPHFNQHLSRVGVDSGSRRRDGICSGLLRYGVATEGTGVGLGGYWFLALWAFD